MFLARLRHASLSDLCRKLYFKVFRNFARNRVIKYEIKPTSNLEESISFRFFNRRISCTVNELLQVVDGCLKVSELDPQSMPEADSDPRYTWEFHRLTFLHSDLLSNDNKKHGLAIAELLRTETAFLLLNRWLAANRDYKGANWASAMESAYRLISILSRFYNDEVSERLSSDQMSFLDSLCDMHCRHIKAGLSLGSSLNNHTVVEYCALLLDAGTRGGDAKAIKRWAKLLQSTLEDLYKQGVLLEYSTGYQVATQDVLDLLIASISAEFTRELAPLVQKAAEVSTAFELDDIGNIYSIGDWDSSRPLFFGASDQDGGRRGIIGDCFIAKTCNNAVLLDGQPCGLPPLFGHARDDVGQVQYYCGATQIIGSGGTTSYSAGLARRGFERSYKNHSTLRSAGSPLIKSQHPFVCEKLAWPATSWRATQSLAADLVICYQDLHHTRGVSLSNDGSTMVCQDTIKCSVKDMPVEVTWIFPTGEYVNNLRVSESELDFNLCVADMMVNFKTSSSTPFKYQIKQNRNTSVGYCTNATGLSVTLFFSVTRSADLEAQCRII